MWAGRAATVLLAVALAGCGSGSDGAAGGDAVAATDAGLTPTPAACGLTAPPIGWTYPEGPYGGGVGEVFADFALQDCDGNPVSFGELLGGAELVLFNVGAGWCQPCIDETEELEAKVNQRFCGRGLRTIQVLFEDDQSRPATKLFCRQWRESFGLTFPVVVDPLFTTERYFEAAQTPLNLLVDKAGVIRFRATGKPPSDFEDRIDQLLPGAR